MPKTKKRKKINPALIIIEHNCEFPLINHVNKSYVRATLLSSKATIKPNSNNKYSGGFAKKSESKTNIVWANGEKNISAIRLPEEPSNFQPKRNPFNFATIKYRLTKCFAAFAYFGCLTSFFCSLSRSSVLILFFFSVLISALPTLSTHHPSPINRDTYYSMCVCIYIFSAISSTFRFPFYLLFYVHQYFSIFPLSRHSFCSNDANVIRLICISYRKVVSHRMVSNDII